MTYEKLDKEGWLDGRLVLEIIGIEQIQNADEFIVFRNESGETLAVESVATLKHAYGLQAETWEEAAEAYVEILANTAPQKTPEEQIKALQDQNDLLSQTMDSILTEILPSLF